MLGGKIVGTAESDVLIQCDEGCLGRMGRDRLSRAVGRGIVDDDDFVADVFCLAHCG